MSANDMDDALGDESDSGDTSGMTGAAEASQGSGGAQGGSETGDARSVPSTAEFVVPPPPSETRISWTGLAAPEAAPEPAPQPAEATAPVIEAAPAQVSVAAEAEPVTTVETAAVETPAAEPAVPAEPTAETPSADKTADKKVVWSSSPSNYGSSSYSSRRDDY